MLELILKMWFTKSPFLALSTKNDTLKASPQILNKNKISINDLAIQLSEIYCIYFWK